MFDYQAVIQYAVAMTCLSMMMLLPIPRVKGRSSKCSYRRSLRKAPRAVYGSYKLFSHSCDLPVLRVALLSAQPTPHMRQLREGEGGGHRHFVNRRAIVCCSLQLLLRRPRAGVALPTVPLVTGPFGLRMDPRVWSAHPRAPPEQM